MFRMMHARTVTGTLSSFTLGMSATAATCSLPRLKRALQRIGCDLGFISDDNTRKLESLVDIEWVQVKNYQEDPNDQLNGIRFAQKGFYLDAAGMRWGVDDVWFSSSV